jgi:hypothetical protein
LRIDYGNPRKPEKPVAWLLKWLDAARTAVRQALKLLGWILQRALEAGYTKQPGGLVRKANLPRRREVRPLAPSGCGPRAAYVMRR